MSVLLVTVTVSAGLGAGPRVDAEEKPSNKPPRIDERKLPPEVRESYKVFRAKCGKCHTIDRVLRAPYDTLDQWKEVIARMAKLRGANISAQDQKQAAEFMAYYLEHLRSPRPAAPPPADAAVTPDR